VEIAKCVRFQGGTGWERPTSDGSRDSSAGRTGRRWTTPGGTLAIPINTAKEKKHASFCAIQNWATLRALLLRILCAKWAKSLQNVSERNDHFHPQNSNLILYC
jgi:hypothetical protein